MRTLFLLMTSATVVWAAEPPEPPKPDHTLTLWPGKAPGESAALPPEASVVGPKDDVRRVSNVSSPEVAIYMPKEKATGTFVLIAPGGGYNILAIEHEGTMVAQWLNRIGVAAGVLKYRVPRRKDVSPVHAPMLQDAQRAMGLVRARATEWKLDAKKIGMLGFSAGGHLTTVTSLTEKRTYDAIDDADRLASIPDFAVLVYPAYLVEKDNTTLKPEIVVTKTAPPMFLVHASDDPLTSEGSVALYRALKKVNVPAEMHLYASGGHGFGMTKGTIAKDWPQRLEGWLKTRTLIP
jgi:acetyl esterase/lipase